MNFRHFLPTKKESFMRKRCENLRKFCFVLFLFLCVNLGYAKLDIIVKSSPGWGPISDADVEYLCQEIVDCFEEHYFAARIR